MKKHLKEVTSQAQAEEKRIAHACALISSKQHVIKELIDKYSALTRIERVFVYCLRFLSNVRRIPSERILSHLTTTEIEAAHMHLARYAQMSAFAEEIISLKKNNEFSSTSRIIQLHPFLDEQHLLRVGGRLQHSSWAFERKYPIILPDKSKFSRLLFERQHQRLLHGSQIQMLTSIRNRYWPIRGRNLARRVCRECVRCARANPQELSQLMGSLPRDRVCSDRAFAVTGIDFAGPITTLVNKSRGRKTNKSYVALFICFATKAVHLEAVSELTSAAFLATLRRFISRRGRPHIIFSDNATKDPAQNKGKPVYSQMGWGWSML
ncbi:PREDICTED: uncharacterized protein LOC108773931 [Cyphomyrmex costatus]|uniref:uncharacterized protein LOC108773931 n=1 Tax=Cyphomyrmex costatus TaxID=456900 RepID=UPI0008523021|nr:PREDICTED: uncharacterized protein LOC108773931 [Cyphomyrmex costatus]